jgi:phage shock protein A
VDKNEDDLARAAIERMQTVQRLSQSFQEQVNDQCAQVETLKSALLKLEQKLDEAKSKRELLLARHRRSVAMNKAARAQSELGTQAKSATFDRLKDRVNFSEAVASAEVEMVSDDMGERLVRLERDSEVERLLAELKNRRQLTAGS